MFFNQHSSAPSWIRLAAIPPGNHSHRCLARPRCLHSPRISNRILTRFPRFSSSFLLPACCRISDVSLLLFVLALDSPSGSAFWIHPLDSQPVYNLTVSFNDVDDSYESWSVNLSTCTFIPKHAGSNLRGNIALIHYRAPESHQSSCPFILLLLSRVALRSTTLRPAGSSGVAYTYPPLPVFLSFPHLFPILHSPHLTPMSRLRMKASRSDPRFDSQSKYSNKSPPPSPSHDRNPRLPEPYPIPTSNPASQYTLLEKLGTGSFGTVYKAMHNDTKQIVAIKQIGAPPFMDL